VRSSGSIAPQSNVASEAQNESSVFDPVLLYGVFGLLLFGPLAFGAVEPWSIFVLEAGSGALFVIWSIRQVKTGELRILGNPLFLPMSVFALLVGIQLVTGRTSYRHQTVSSLLLYVAYGLLSFLVVQCLRKTSQIRILAQVFCSYGYAVATFAMFSGLAPNGKLYWLRMPRHGGWIYGPYVNHNHYAGLMEMFTPIPLVVALSEVVKGPRKILAAGTAAFMASTIFLSGSRGGMLAFVVQIAILSAILIRRRGSRKLAFTLGSFFVLTGGVLAWLGGGQLVARMASIHQEARTEVSGQTRMDINRDGLAMAKLRPLLGWGLGVFPTVYPQYRTFYTNLFVNEAHDDYVQLLVEMGALGFAVMLWFLVVSYYHASKKLKHWTKDPNGAVALAAILGATGIVVHSFVDFNLQIPANAALFYVLCTVAAMEPRFSPFDRGRRRVRWLKVKGPLSVR
jgi:O-antigen ligase